MKSNFFKALNGTRILRVTYRSNRLIFAAAAALVAVGCTDNATGDFGAGGVFRGAVVADEPQAARVAAEILSQGGSAVDAGVALYFALSVTYPSAASMGGGGVCLVNDWSSGEVHSLNFPAPRTASAGLAVRTTAVPANVRGMAALHARYGVLDWRILLAPAERIARFGEPLTRASVRAFDSDGGALLTQWDSTRVFAPAGSFPREGMIVRQPDLADTIATLRTDGAGAMYTGELAGRLVNGARLAGGSLAREDLRNLLPSWQLVTGVPFGTDNAYFAPPPAGAGLLAGQMWEMLADRDRYREAGGGERARLLVESARRAWLGRARWLADDGTKVDAESLLSRKAARKAMTDYESGAAPGSGVVIPAPSGSADPSSTGFVVLDALGGAAACNFTAYRPFGTGTMATGTGILLAPAPGPEDRNPLSLGPMMVFNDKVMSIKYVAVGGSGPAAATAMMSVAAESVMTGGRLDIAMKRPRAHPGTGAAVHVESTLDETARSALAERGNVLSATPALGRVNAIHCPPGYPTEPSKTLCWAENDSRGHGFVAFPR